MYKILGSDQKEYGPVTSDQLRQWIVERRLHAQSLVRPDGAENWQPVSQIPEFAATLATAAAPPPMQMQPVAPAPDSGVATLIPYKNPKALIAYYLGVFSLIPILGLFLGITAFILGLQGLKFARTHPGSRGKAHAWVGIIAGGFFGLLYLVVVVMIVIGMVVSRR